jgi:hypothetical protein
MILTNKDTTYNMNKDVIKEFTVRKTVQSDIRMILQTAIDLHYRELDGYFGPYLLDFDELKKEAYFELYTNGRFVYYMTTYTLNVNDTAAILSDTAFEVVRKATYELIPLEVGKSLEEATVEKTILEKVASLIDSAFGESKAAPSLEVKKQFNDETFTTTEFLYVAPNTPDGVGDAYPEEDLEPMLKSFNLANEEKRLQSGLFHSHSTNGYHIDKAYAATEDYTLGIFDIKKGQPLVDLIYTNKELYQARVEGRVMGPSIGARAKEIIEVSEEGVEKSLGDTGELINMTKDNELDTLKSPTKVKRILKGLHFNWPNPHLSLTDPSAGGACSLLNDIIVEKSMMEVNKTQQAILDEIKEEFVPILKELGAGATSVTKTNEEGKETDMSVELQKQLDDQAAIITKMARDNGIMKAHQDLGLFKLDAEIEKELAEALVDGGNGEAVLKALTALKASIPAPKVEDENLVAKALSEELGEDAEAEPDTKVEKTLLEQLEEKITAQLAGAK